MYIHRTVYYGMYPFMLKYDSKTCIYILIYIINETNVIYNLLLILEYVVLN
jgi:hypothetical protein